MTKSKAPTKQPTARTPFDRLTRDGKLNALRVALVAQQDAAVATSEVVRGSAELLKRLAARVERFQPLLDDLYATLHVIALVWERQRGVPLNVDEVAQLVGELEREAKVDLARPKGELPTSRTCVMLEGVARALEANRVAERDETAKLAEATAAAAAVVTPCTCDASAVTDGACAAHGRPTLRMPGVEA